MIKIYYRVACALIATRNQSRRLCCIINGAQRGIKSLKDEMYYER